jgi:hypothetical protein
MDTEITVISDPEADLVMLAQESGLVKREQAAGDDLGLDPITAAIVVGGVLTIGKFVLSVVERWRGGVRIDLTSHPATVERLGSVPYGLIVVLTASGDVRIDTADEPKDAAERIVTTLFRLPIDATIGAVTKAVQAVRLGSGA